MTILFTVLTLFFKMYVSKMETRAFQQEFTTLIDHSMASDASLHKIMSSAVGRTVTKSKNYAALEQLYAEPDAGVRENNEWLFRTAFTVVAGLVGMVACSTLAAGGAVPLGRLLLENAVTFALVGAVEATLFVRVISKYNPAPPSVMVDSAIRAAQEAVT